MNPFPRRRSDLTIPRHRRSPGASRVLLPGHGNGRHRVGRDKEPEEEHSEGCSQSILPNTRVSLRHNVNRSLCSMPQLGRRLITPRQLLHPRHHRHWNARRTSAQASLPSLLSFARADELPHDVFLALQ